MMKIGKKIDIIIGIVILVMWGLVNEYLHIVYNNAVDMVSFFSILIEERILFDISIVLIALTMIGAASWIMLSKKN